MPPVSQLKTILSVPYPGCVRLNKLNNETHLALTRPAHGSQLLRHGHGPLVHSEGARAGVGSTGRTVAAVSSGRLRMLVVLNHTSHRASNCASGPCALWFAEERRYQFTYFDLCYCRMGHRPRSRTGILVLCRDIAIQLPKNFAAHKWCSQRRN